MKRAYLVVGPESSGNRKLAAQLIEAGCVGGTEFDHPFMHELPTEEDPVVVVRSYPHGNQWPDVADLFEILRGRGYCVRALVTVRDPLAVMRSQVARRHHPRELAWSNYQQAYLSLFEQLRRVNLWYALVPFDVGASDELLAILGLGAPT